MSTEPMNNREQSPVSRASHHRKGSGTTRFVEPFRPSSAVDRGPLGRLPGARRCRVGALQYGSGIVGSGLVGALAYRTPRPMGGVIALAGIGSLPLRAPPRPSSAFRISSPFTYATHASASRSASPTETRGARLHASPSAALSPR